METTDTTKSPTFVTMDEFLEYLETRGSRNTTSPGDSTGILRYPPAVAAPEADLLPPIGAVDHASVDTMTGNGAVREIK